MAKAVATINLKGGVGKSTMTAALAEFMAGDFGKRVLLIDLDPQTNLTTMMIGSDQWQALNESGRTLKALFEEALDSKAATFDIEDAIQRNVSPLANLGGIDLLASSLDMIEISEEVAAWQYDEPDSLEPVLVLKRAVDRIRDQYDYILIDCPPNMGIITRNGLMLADAYVIPTIPDVLSTYGIPQIQKRVRMFSDKTGHKIKALGLIITKYRKGTNLHRDTIQRLQNAVLDYDALPAHERELTERPPNVIPVYIPDAIDHIPNLLKMAGDQLAKGSIDLVFATSIDLLLAWMQSPQAHPRRNLAHWLPVLAIMGMGTSATRTGGAAPAELALSLIDGNVVEKTAGDTLVWRDQGFAVSVRVPEGKSLVEAEIAIVIDDNDSALSVETRNQWREWLRWSNLLELRPLTAVVTTRRHLSSASMNIAPADTPVQPVAADSDSLSGPWREVYDGVIGPVQALVTALAKLGVPVPEVGEEVSGLPVEISWPSLRIAVDPTLDGTDQQELSEAGWTLCAADAESVAEAIQAAALR